jgi:signal transduction histidine kinase
LPASRDRTHVELASQDAELPSPIEQETRAYHALLSALTRGASVSELSTLAADRAMRLVAADGALVARVDGSALSVLAAHGLAAPLAADGGLPRDEISRAVLERNQPIVFGDGAPGAPEWRLPVAAHAGIVAPIYAEGRPSGALAVLCSDAAMPGSADCARVCKLAEFLGLGFALADAHHARTRLLERVFSAQEEERRYIARELHDGTSQSLMSLVVRLRAIESTAAPATQQALHDVRQLAKATLEEVGRIAHGLHPVILDELGLEQAVRRHAAEFAASHGLKIDVHMHGLRGLGRLPQSVELMLYRIVQEALRNVARHAEASTVSVLLERARDYLRLIVEDDGKGFAVEQLDQLADVPHLGLHGIRERAAQWKGVVTVESEPGVGTTVYVELPL